MCGKCVCVLFLFMGRRICKLGALLEIPTQDRLHREFLFFLFHFICDSNVDKEEKKPDPSMNWRSELEVVDRTSRLRIERLCSSVPA